MAEQRYFTGQCFNPFKKSNHRIRDKKKLRNVTDWMIDSYSELPKTAKVCHSCRKELSDLKKTEEFGQQSEEMEDSESMSREDPNFTPESEIVKTLNVSLQELGESPIDKKKTKSKAYASSKIKKFNSAMRRELFTNVERSSESETETPEEAVLNNLKFQFSNTTSNVKKVMILTCLPESWSIRKIMREFNAPNYMVRKSKKLLKNKGILASPNQKPGKSLPTEIAENIKAFYESDEISRQLPGIKDCISVRTEDGEKVKISKRLVLSNLMEAYRSYKEKFPNMKVSFSKFAELRPKHCILAGQSGTHTVCVCITHQNIKLMIENAKLHALTDGKLKTYKHCLAKMLCNPASINCYLGECLSCPGTEEIKEILENAFDENMIEKVTFRQWISVDRCNLETLEKSAMEFIDLFCEKLSVLARHDFIAKQQSSFMNEIKNNLADGEYAVMCDFSENYTFVLQDEVQSYHWTSEQATVHPFVIYYKSEGTIEHLSLVVISESLEHNTVAVYCFQRKLIAFLKTKFDGKIKKIFYFSDGSAAQYKNKKNFANLCFHKHDFNIEAEWHFSATAHGKGPCDGVGGTVKRLAYRASLQRPYENQITTPIQLYQWAVENIPSINFVYSTQDEYIDTEKFLQNRLSKSNTIKGTQKLHAFIPVASSISKIEVKTFSHANESTIVKISISEDRLQLSEIKGYVCVKYEQNWWLAYVLTKNEDEDEVKVSFLHPAGPTPSFSYPSKPDILWVSVAEILCLANPMTETGRVYKLPENEILQINEIYENFKQ